MPMEMGEDQARCHQGKRELSLIFTQPVGEDGNDCGTAGKEKCRLNTGASCRTLPPITPPASTPEEDAQEREGRGV